MRNFEGKKYFEEIRWEYKPECPYCGASKYSILGTKYHCNNCNVNFTVTTQTFMHNTKLDLSTWKLVLNLDIDKYSVRELAAELRVSKNTASLIKKKINHAILNKDKLFFKTKGIIL